MDGRREEERWDTADAQGTGGAGPSLGTALSSPRSSALGACHPPASNPSIRNNNGQVKAQPVEATRPLLLKRNIEVPSPYFEPAKA